MFRTIKQLGRSIVYVTLASLLLFNACGELQQTEPETFYSETVPPQIQEFRWSNGKMPKTFDPARVSAPPETDIVRAIYEGLTDTDPKTLKAVPAIAKSWNSSGDFKKWTFKLRRDALWSNGEKVTAEDFVRSWKRLVAMGSEMPHHTMLHNISGVHSEEVESLPTPTPAPTPRTVTLKSLSEKPTPTPVEKVTIAKKIKPRVKPPLPLGIKAVGKYELQIVLNESDEEFPKLVAHPMFRPVFGNGDYFENTPLGADIVTNGPFRITSVGNDGVTLDREEKYFDRELIKLERVRFVPSEDADAALASYRAGDVDVVTNTSFEPLALKLLAPYVDFRTTTHSAVNFYEFNLTHAPFNDRRVREALAIAIDRKKITEGEMEGSTKPAYDFLPFDQVRERRFETDTTKAKKLLETAGFPNAEGFPKIRLVINRNNTQEKIAKSVAGMWKEALNIDTEVIVKESGEIDSMRQEGDFDIMRRGVVLPTADETANMLAIFAADKSNVSNAIRKTQKKTNPLDMNANVGSILSNSNQSNSNVQTDELLIDTGQGAETILTEADAIASIPAIPLYFPTSYSLVKPYVMGFEMNTLDAPSLKNVSINNAWQPGKKGNQSAK